MKINVSKLKYFPLAVNLKGKHALVVGGGKVAERKTLSLYQAGARVQVVAPNITVALKSLLDKGKIVWVKRVVNKGDVDGMHLVIAATNNKKVNESISRWAKNKLVWVNVVDKPALSDFISPAVFNNDQAIIAVYTDGKNPVLSRDVKNFLKDNWNEFLSYRNKL
ncbi:MAG: bifunctional precorrin-2 dehydrogenase/sirohydrochlorin ferrochelatase [Candidatus Zapsychrus exili]|nr:bifunctional precorrin-2 dehydrogenase/sirohydrochlorin ferrochelatase [Candidatus Zapsychrus exili]